MTKININTANEEMLAQIKPTGSVIAARIVAYRENNGPFRNIEEIMNVKGIGQKTFESIKDQIIAK